MNVLHLLSTGDAGGIEILCKEIFLNSRHNNLFCFTYRGGAIAKEMQELNAQVYILDNISKKNIIKVIKSAESIVTENNIDRIIIHHSSPMSWIIACYLNKRYSIPFYVYVHGNLIDELNVNKKKLIFLRKYIYKITCQKSNGLIAISNSVSKSIIELYPNIKDKINIIYNGVDLNKFDNSNLFLEINTVPTILFVGRLIYEKGVHLLVEAVSKLNTDIRCIIIGDGEERANLETLSSSLGVGEKIKFLGTRRDIFEWHKKADLFIHPAIWEEGFGITLVESMASGLPCIAFNKGAIPEIIEDGISGFIVKENSVDELVTVIESVIDIMKTNPDKWRKIKESAKLRAQKFDINLMVSQLDELLVRL